MKEELWPLRRPISAETSSSWVALAGITHPDPDFHITIKHSYSTIIDFVVSGYGTILVDDVPYQVGPGDIYILPKHHRLDYWSDPKAPMKKYFYNVMGNMIPMLLTYHGLEGHIIIGGTNALPHFKKGIRLIREGKLRGRALQRELGVIIHRIIVAAANTLPDAAAGYTEEVKILKTYLDNRINRKVTMDELCGLVNKSKVQVTRIFRDAVGQTPYDYFLSLKLDQAKLLLANTSRPVKEIGYRLAFGDEYHFSSFFKKRTGVSPLQYRKEG